MDSGLADEIVAATLADGGATVDVTSGTLLTADDSWYFPRYPECTRIVPVDGLAAAVLAFAIDHEDVLRTERRWLGTWLNPGSGQCYLDVITRSASRSEALALARRYGREGGRRILAICNPLRQATEYV